MDHQQAYYVWLERAWRAGLRMVVAQTADDEPLCRIEPRRMTRTCSETASVKAQIRTLKGMQNYIDAQDGGPGAGLVPARLFTDTGPPRDGIGQARRDDRD